jgi:hypothetical protein
LKKCPWAVPPLPKTEVHHFTHDRIYPAINDHHTPQCNIFTGAMADKRKIDIINDLLEDCILAYPMSSFIISLYKQYQQRGSLSKKQLQGLYSKASKITDVSFSKLGTLEAIIKRMPTRYKSELPPPTPLFEKNNEVRELIDAILAKYPQHKRVLFLKAKFDNNELITSAELTELKKFKQVLK